MLNLRNDSRRCVVVFAAACLLHQLETRRIEKSKKLFGENDDFIVYFSFLHLGGPHRRGQTRLK